MPDKLLPITPTPLERDALGARVFCDDLIGLVWHVVTELPPAQVMARMNVRSEAVLRALTLLEEHDESRADDGERAELHRLEGKLDLVLDLLSELLRERKPGAAQIAIRFSAEGLCWRAATPPPVGTLMLTEWYMQRAWPVALRIHVRVIGAEAQADEHLVCARLEGVSDSVADWLDKLVFRRHRRSVAHQRISRTAEEHSDG